MDQICNKCGKLIKHGDSYVAIIRNVEYFENKLHKKHEVISVVDSEELKTFCTSCGEIITANSIKDIIDLFVQVKIPHDFNFSEN
jgi:hypothetical protein